MRGSHAALPCAAPLRGGIQPCKSAFLPICLVDANEPEKRTLKRIQLRTLELLILSVSLLSACSQLPRVETGSEYQRWLEHQIAVSEINSWKIKGRISIKNGKESGTATLHWNQVNSDYELRVITPFGQGTYLLKGSPNRVTMQGPKNEILTADTPDELLYEGLGWTVHLAGLMYWIRGIPEPDIDYSQLLLDREGRLSEMEQSGFNVSVQRYTDQDGVSLPGKLFIKNDNIQLKMVIQNWNI